MQHHRELAAHIERNSKLELVNPSQLNVGQSSFHVKCLEKPLNQRSETLNEQLQFEVPTSFEFYINNSKEKNKIEKKALYEQDSDE